MNQKTFLDGEFLQLLSLTGRKTINNRNVINSFCSEDWYKDDPAIQNAKIDDKLREAAANNRAKYRQK